MNATAATLLCAGLLGGVGLGLLLRTPAPAPLQLPEPPAVGATPAEERPSGEVGAEGGTEPTLPATPAPIVGPGPLPAAAEARATMLADQIRSQARRMLDTADAVARRRVVDELARERAAREDMLRGGTMAYLRKLEQSWVAPLEMLSSDDAFGALFERKSAGGEVAGTALAEASTSFSDGDTVRLAPGRYEFAVSAIVNGRPLAKDLLFQGAGMDETLLVLNSELRPKGDVHALTLRDLTIHCNDNYLEAMRDAPYTLRLDRCRVIGFDMGAGGSCMLSGRVGAFFATDCRIEAGYGRAPGYGNLFDVRGALLVRMVNCDIVGPFRSVTQRGRAAQAFERCRFTRMSRGASARIEHADAAQFTHCTFEAMSSDEETARSRQKRLPVTAINPSWHAR